MVDCWVAGWRPRARRRQRARRFGECARRRQHVHRVRHGHDERERMGRRRRRTCTSLKYVLEKNLGCTVNMTKLPESSRSSRRWPTARSTSSSRTGTTSISQVNQKYLESARDRHARLERRHRADRLVHSAYLLKQYPAVQDVAGPEGQGERLQVARVRLAGHVPRRRPLVRAEGQAADQAGSASTSSTSRVGAEPAQVARWTQAVQAEEADPLLLVHAAVPERPYHLSEVKLPPRGKALRTTRQPEAGRQLDIYACDVRADRSSTS